MKQGLSILIAFIFFIGSIVFLFAILNTSNYISLGQAINRGLLSVAVLGANVFIVIRVARMKHLKAETIAKICQLTSGVIAAICGGALVGLVLLVLADLISYLSALACVPFIMLIGWLDASWINRHFVDGEWI